MDKYTASTYSTCEEQDSRMGSGVHDFLPGEGFILALLISPYEHTVLSSVYAILINKHLGSHWWLTLPPYIQGHPNIVPSKDCGSHAPTIFFTRFSWAFGFAFICTVKHSSELFSLREYHIPPHIAFAVDPPHSFERSWTRLSTSETTAILTFDNIWIDTPHCRCKLMACFGGFCEA